MKNQLGFVRLVNDDIAGSSFGARHLRGVDIDFATFKILDAKRDLLAIDVQDCHHMLANLK